MPHPNNSLNKSSLYQNLLNLNLEENLVLRRRLNEEKHKFPLMNDILDNSRVLANYFNKSFKEEL